MPMGGAGANLQPHPLVRNSSSLSTQSADSDFAFDFAELCSDEPPVSPKLHNFSPTWEIAMVSTTHSSPSAHLFYQDADGVQNVESPTNDVDSTGAGSDPPHKHHVVVDGQQKKKASLRSLMLERRELEQLPCVVGPSPQSNGDVQIVNLGSSPSSSSSSEANSLSNSPSVSSPSNTSSSISSCKHKSKRWSLMKLDFLQAKKLMDYGSPSKAADNSHNHNLNHHQDGPGRAGIDEMSGSYMCQHDDAIDHKFVRESQGRQSTSSLGSISGSHDAKKRDRAHPVSPAASPSRSPAGNGDRSGGGGGGGAARGRGGHVRSPMSPHAQHYQQRRAHEEELRRKTFLPYRQSLLGACFFPPSSADSSPSQVACLTQ